MGRWAAGWAFLTSRAGPASCEQTGWSSVCARCSRAKSATVGLAGLDRSGRQPSPASWCQKDAVIATAGWHNTLCSCRITQGCPHCQSLHRYALLHFTQRCLIATAEGTTQRGAATLHTQTLIALHRDASLPLLCGTPPCCPECRKDALIATVPQGCAVICRVCATRMRRHLLQTIAVMTACWV